MRNPDWPQRQPVKPVTVPGSIPAMGAPRSIVTPATVSQSPAKIVPYGSLPTPGVGPGFAMADHSHEGPAVAGSSSFWGTNTDGVTFGAIQYLDCPTIRSGGGWVHSGTAGGGAGTPYFDTGGTGVHLIDWNVVVHNTSGSPQVYQMEITFNSAAAPIEGFTSTAVAAAIGDSVVLTLGFTAMVPRVADGPLLTFGIYSVSGAGGSGTVDESEIQIVSI